MKYIPAILCSFATGMLMASLAQAPICPEDKFMVSYKAFVDLSDKVDHLERRIKALEERR
jgi:hypothetical protein